MQENVAGRASVGALQIAVLALLTSTLAAIGMLFVLRSLVRRRGPQEPAANLDVATGNGSQMPSKMPRHFTENLVVPGFTDTGVGVEKQDDSSGRSPEGE